MRFSLWSAAVVALCVVGWQPAQAGKEKQAEKAAKIEAARQQAQAKFEAKQQEEEAKFQAMLKELAAEYPCAKDETLDAIIQFRKREMILSDSARAEAKAEVDAQLERDCGSTSEAAQAQPKAAAAQPKAGMHMSEGRVAVLEMSGALTPQERGIFTDEVRGAVVSARGSAVTVMTRENMEVMLTDMGIDADCVAEGACEVETARNLNVDFVISGSIVQMGETLVVSVKLHDVKTGGLLSTSRTQGATSLELLNAMQPATAELLASEP